MEIMMPRACAPSPTSPGIAASCGGSARKLSLGHAHCPLVLELDDCEAAMGGLADACGPDEQPSPPASRGGWREYALGAVGHLLTSGLLFFRRETSRAPSLSESQDRRASSDSRKRSRTISDLELVEEPSDWDGERDEEEEDEEDEDDDGPSPSFRPLNASPLPEPAHARRRQSILTPPVNNPASRPSSGHLLPLSRPQSGALVHPRSGPLLPTARAREIVFENVGFEFEGAQFGMNQLDLRVPPGSIVTVTGGSGSGKSTLLGLLTGIIRPSRGRVTFGGRPLDRIPEAEWGDLVRFATEAAPIFAGTVRENIAFGQNVSFADVQWAARIAKIDEEIAAMRDGYETPVDNGLPASLRQRVSLARALVARPALLVLDEALAAVDGETNQRINGMLHEAARGTTIVRATRRLFLSTAFSSDLVVVLDKGKVVEAAAPAHLNTPRMSPS